MQLPPAKLVFLMHCGNAMVARGLMSSGDMSSLTDRVPKPWAWLFYDLAPSLCQHQSHRSRIRLVPAEAPDPLEDHVCSKENAFYFVLSPHPPGAFAITLEDPQLILPLLFPLDEPPLQP